MNDRTKLSAYRVLNVLVLTAYVAMLLLIYVGMREASDLDTYGVSRFNVLCVSFPIALFLTCIYFASSTAILDRIWTIKAGMGDPKPRPRRKNYAPYIVIAGLGILLAYAYSGWVDPYMLVKSYPEVTELSGVRVMSFVPSAITLAMMCMAHGIMRYRETNEKEWNGGIE